MADDLLLEQWLDPEVDSDLETESFGSGDENDEMLDDAEVVTESLPKVENTLSFKLGEDYNSPVYTQRYLAVADIIRAPIPGTDTKIKTVVDFGSAELNFFKYLKNIPSLSEVSLVDIDASVLESHSIKTRPLAFDFLHRRKKSLTVRVFAGSVADKDQRVQGVDAVTCIELIEHLNEDVLSLLPSVIFGYIRPKLVAITTPNVEFNVLFPDSTGFRHWDHKFEWTRLQFRKWCLSIVDKYSDYVFTVDGIGEGPPGSEHLGCCSQMAVFTNTNRIKPTQEPVGTPYNLIAEHVYPSERRNRTTAAEQTLMTAEYYIHMLGKYLLDNEAEGDTVWVPLKKILAFAQMAQHNCDESQLGNMLAEKGWEISEDGGSFSLLYVLETEEDSEDDDTHMGDGDTEICVLMEDVQRFSLDEINEAGDGLEDWDAV